MSMWHEEVQAFGGQLACGWANTIPAVTFPLTLPDTTSFKAIEETAAGCSETSQNQPRLI